MPVQHPKTLNGSNHILTEETLSDTQLLAPAATVEVEAPPANWVVNASVLWDHRRLLARVAAIALILSLVTAFVLPKQYESTARIMPPDSSGGGSAIFAALAGRVLGGGSSGLSSLAGSLLGATSIKPGRVNVIGTLLSVLVLAFSFSGVQQLGAPFYVQFFFNGAILIVAVGLSVYAARRRQRAVTAATPSAS